ncbi:MAG: hypothetical protein ACHP85_00665 [Burkholderiales bacterium]|jgi:hypothetical protein
MPPLALPLLLISLLAADNSVYQVVAPVDAPLNDISMDELRRIFLMRRLFWKPGHPIRLVLPGSGRPTREFMLARVCQKTEGEYRRLVLEVLYRGDTDQPPKVGASDGDILKLLATERESLGLVATGADLLPGLKVLRIDGRLPTEPGYPLVP